MIAACKRGRIDMILTKSTSRFARNTVDCLKVIRTLKDRGIGIIFEKENINTLTETSEFLVTLFSSFAQAESESMGKNIDLGNKQAMLEGKISFHYDKTLGYRKGPDGRPEIDPEEAETVRLIYRLYLDGWSLGDIQKELTEKNIPTARGIQGWSRQVIQNILLNGCAIIGPNQQTLVVQAVALIWFTYGSKESTGGDSRNSSYHAAGLVFAG